MGGGGWRGGGWREESGQFDKDLTLIKDKNTKVLLDDFLKLVPGPQKYGTGSTA